MKKKRLIALGLTVAMTFAITGCSAKKTSSEDTKETAAVEEKKETDPSSEESVEEPEFTTRDLSSVPTPMKNILEVGYDFQGALVSKLGFSADDIRKTNPSKMHNQHAFNGIYILYTNADEPRLECMIYDNPQQAREEFENYYSTFNESFLADSFDGDYQACLEEEYGYIVLDGEKSGARIFGDYYATSEVYGGIYYADNILIIAMPKNEIKNTRVKDVISRLGLPMADGTNT